MSEDKGLNIKIRPVGFSDIPTIKEIFSMWMIDEVTGNTDLDEVDHYVNFVRESIQGTKDSKKYDSHYMVAINEDKEIVGVVGYRKPIQKMMSYTLSNNPAEIASLYVSKEKRKKGIGTQLLKAMEKQLKKRGYKEVVVRSGKRHKKTGWGFYDKLNKYKRVGMLTKGGKTSRVWRKILA